MAKKWAEVIASPEYQGLSAPEKANAQAQYFDQVVKPQLPADQVDEAHAQFYNQYPVSNAAPQPAEQEPSLLDKATPYAIALSNMANPNAIGSQVIEDVQHPIEAAKRGLRTFGGIVEGLGDTAISVVNLAGRGVQEGVNMLTGETGQYTPYAPMETIMPENMKPQTIQEKLPGQLAPFALPVGEAFKAAEGANLLTRGGALVARNVQAAIPGTLSQNPEADPEKVTNDLLVNTAAGVGGELGLGALVKSYGLVKRVVTPVSMAERAAKTVTPEYAEAVYQSGDEAGQQAFKTSFTGEAGESTVNPSQAFNPETKAGRRYIKEEQRSRAEGTASPYEQNTQQQFSGQSFERAVNEADTGADLQAGADTILKNVKAKANDLYNSSITNYQKILDQNGIVEMKMPGTRQAARNALEAHTKQGVKLNTETRRLLNDFDKTTISNVNVLDNWKRSLNEARGKAIANKDYNSATALGNVVDSLKTEADNFAQFFDPNAKNLYTEADNYFSQSRGDFGPKSLLSKFANTENPVKANEVFLGSNQLKGRAQGAINTNKLTDLLDRGVASGEISPELAQSMREGLGNETRSQAFDYANANAQFNPSTFANRLHQYTPQAEAAGATNVNNALRQAAELTKTRATAGADFAENVGDLAARGIGIGAGAAKAGPAGAAAGNYLGGKVSDFLPRLIDKITNTAGKSKAMIDFVSQPENAKKVLDIIEASGHSVESIPNSDLVRIVGLATRFGAGTSQQEDKKKSALPTLTQPAPAPAQEFNVTTPEPEQHAQAAKAPTPEPENDLATHMYRSLSVAETGGIKNRFIRTRAAEAGLSTAYGPSQLTVTTAKNFYDKHPDLFNDEQKAYMQRFIEQGQRMKEAPKDDPVYGYGKQGTMGNSAEDRRTYYEVNRIMLDQMIKKNKGDLEKTLREWRYGDPNADINKRDPGYARKVRQAWKRFNEPAAPKPASNKAWKGAA
ncbi:hypothetical protein CH513_15400 [Salmonella enterica subsp. enterica serovar Infantis]|nr:hypothetical protein [Salmonella enterica subsp. enterica serovar Infantis]